MAPAPHCPARRRRYPHRLPNPGITPTEQEQVRALYRRQLTDQLVNWHTTHLYLVASQLISD